MTKYNPEVSIHSRASTLFPLYPHSLPITRAREIPSYRSSNSKHTSTQPLQVTRTAYEVPDSLRISKEPPAPFTFSPPPRNLKNTTKNREEARLPSFQKKRSCKMFERGYLSSDRRFARGNKC